MALRDRTSLRRPTTLTKMTGMSFEHFGNETCERLAAMAESLCPRCDRPLPPPKPTGRPRIWCSDGCRVLAWHAARTRVYTDAELIELFESMPPLDLDRVFG
jgi:hypothetical protein